MLGGLALKSTASLGLKLRFETLVDHFILLDWL